MVVKKGLNVVNILLTAVLLIGIALFLAFSPHKGITGAAISVDLPEEIPENSTVEIPVPEENSTAAELIVPPQEEVVEETPEPESETPPDEEEAPDESPSEPQEEPTPEPEAPAPEPEPAP